MEIYGMYQQRVNILLGCFLLFVGGDWELQSGCCHSGETWYAFWTSYASRFTAQNSAHHRGFFLAPKCSYICLCSLFCTALNGDLHISVKLMTVRLR